MKNTNEFSNVLLLSNLGSDVGDPMFRVGSYTNYLLPIAKQLLAKGDLSVKILSSNFLSNKILEKLVSAGISLDILVEIDLGRLIREQLGDIMIKSYADDIKEVDQAVFAEIIQEGLAGWEPDIILCWETPTKLLRSIYPRALVLDLMPGMFMRPPYPKMISIDPCGLYKDCWYAKENIDEFKAPDDIMEDLNRLRQFYLDHFEEIGTYEAFSGVSKKTHLERAALVPLQISGYFSWRDNCDFRDQFEYLNTVMSRINPDVGCYVTQYTGKLIEEIVITDNVSKYFSGNYDNLIYDKRFDLVDSVSQYIIPNVDSVYAVSSNLGIQAKFFGKKLYSHSRSHLSYLSDKEEASCSTPQNRNIDPFLANYLFRTNFLWNRIEKEPDYLRAILNEFYCRRNQHGINMFPDYETVGNESCAIIRCGNTGASRKNFEPIHVSSKTAARQRVNGHKGVINSGKYDVISFDVFDTLVCRTVLQPKDVFDLIAAGLSDEFGRELGTDFIDYFARNRAGVERKMRLELDRDDAAQVDELKIKDIYEEMLSIYELPLSLSQKLVEFEQEMEYSCLIPRPLGQELYYEALESGRKILIISDFVHPTSFVEEVLRRNGINNWDHIYVSSDIGKKKHSGELFDYVCDDLGLDRCKVIHFGDNSHGDVKMAKAKEIDARHLPSAPYLLSQIFTARKFNVGAIRQSIVTSAILCCHANRYCQAGLNRSSGSDSLELIADNEEFGFLVVGPLMHFFSKWILNQAKASNIQQVVFFARDTKIPYEMAQAATMRGASNLRVRYLPVSRVALSGVDIFAPEDLRKIRIDDFPKNKLLSELCEQRFLLHAEEVSLTELKKWVPGEFNEIQISSLPEMAIYEIAVQSARENWGVIEERLERKRSCFVKLMDQLDIDRSLPTIAVDIGYKGTIHRKVSPFFSDIFLPRFFMAYSNNLGKDPIENLEVFYRKDLVPQSRGDDPFLKYNLIFETLLNEGVGSSMDYRINSDGEVDVVRDSAIDDQHSVIIKEIHRGALEFSAFWTNNCSSIDRHADWDQQMQSYLFSIIMSRPTALEAWMLSGLKFDNNYSGHRTKPLIDLLFKEVAIWNEGEKAVKGVAILNESTPSIKRGSKSQVQRPKLKVYESWRLMYAPIVRFFVVKMGRKKDVEKFDQNPSEFFKQLDDPKYNLIGRLLFP